MFQLDALVLLSSYDVRVACYVALRSTYATNAHYNYGESRRSGRWVEYIEEPLC